MLKWIVTIFMFYLLVWFIIAYNSSYKPISRQIDVKTMSLREPNYTIYKHDSCSWDCRDRSSSSSSWWSYSSWK